ncbi:hypothetical protein Bhyg_06098, partial [Pseudolycoriella hygida]
DECFFVGLGHRGQSSRKGNTFTPNEYRPFQCCPTKLERATKVPKMTAQKLAHKTDNEKSGHFQFSSTKSEPKSEPIVKKPTVPLKKASEVNEKKDSKKALAKGKDKGGKQGIENFFRAVHSHIKNLLGGGDYN